MELGHAGQRLGSECLLAEAYPGGHAANASKGNNLISDFWAPAQQGKKVGNWMLTC